MAITQKTLDFLFENRMQNSKTWFEEHKPQFNEYVISPLAELTTKLAPTMRALDEKLICEPKVGKCISRIYRDVRFSKDKSLYRDVMWIVFIRDKKLNSGLPGFFLEVSPTSFCYGCGYYSAEKNSMEKIRSLILAEDSDFTKALSAYENQSVFSVDGDMYKKSKYPDKADKLKSWLDRKSICFINRSTDFNRLFSEDFADSLASDFMLLEPIYKFLLKAEGQDIRR